MESISSIPILFARRNATHKAKSTSTRYNSVAERVTCRNLQSQLQGDLCTPVTKIASHRINLTHAAQHGWATHQLDIKSTYLNARIKETIYIWLPPGYLKEGQEGKVGKLNKGLYGLKQARRDMVFGVVRSDGRQAWIQGLRC